MCGRYVSRADAALEREWELLPNQFRFDTHYDVRPTTQVPIVRLTDEGRECVPVRWGLVPSWAKGKPGKYATFNARAEGMQKAASYRGPWKNGKRCLFPVLGFYEWQLLEGNNKQKWYVTLPKQGTFALAGLWERSEDLESATICTVEANELMAKVHNKRKRMPLILDPKDFTAWLSDDNDKAEKLIQKYPAARMQAWPVTRTSANDARCVEPEA